MSKLTEHIILNDLKKRGITNYVIEEFTSNSIIAPNTTIPVKERELVYTHLFYVKESNNATFDVTYFSDEKKHEYTNLNTQYHGGGWISELLTVFESNVKIIAQNPPIRFYIQYYKVTY